MPEKKAPAKLADPTEGLQRAINTIGARLDELDKAFKEFKQEVESAVGLKRP